MAAPARGLSSTDLDVIRAALASGRRPKVVFTSSAGQVAGTLGQVVELTDPKVSDEWIVVRFGRDELPFSPPDLAIPARATARRTEPKATARDTAPKAMPPPAVPAPRKENAVTTSAGATPPNGAAPNGAARNGRVQNGSGPDSFGSADERRPAKVAKSRPPASLVVTLAYADKEWTVAANQGTKALAKPYVIKPTDALRMVALIDVPGVHDAVESIIAAERVEAEGRALRLRAELAEIESRLAELTRRA